MFEYPFKNNDKITIGRDKSNTICIDDKKVSSRHASITKEGTILKILDNHSTNGTYINGQKVSTGNLNIGDVVKIGLVEFRYNANKLVYDSDLVSIKSEVNRSATEKQEAQTPLFDLKSGFLSIGREANCGLLLNDNKVSRNHAQIQKQGKTYVITDNNSTHGTFVNGQRINEQVLTNGCKIELGNSIVFFANGKLYNSMPNLSAKKKGISNLFSNKRNIVISSAVAAGLAAVFLISILISSFFGVKRLARFDKLDPSEYPSLGQLVIASPYYYVNADIPTEKNKQLPKYMGTLISDSVKSADLLMGKYSRISKKTEKLYALVYETAAQCDEIYGTSYLAETDLINSLNWLEITRNNSEQTYDAIKMKKYNSDYAFADAVTIKTMSAISAGHCVAEQFILLSSMSATLYNNHMLSSTETINKNLKKIEKITSNEKYYEDIAYMASCAQSIDYLLTYIDIAQTEVALENLNYAQSNMPYVIRNLQIIEQQGKVSKAELTSIVGEVGIMMAFVDVFKPQLEQKLNSYNLKSDFEYYAFNQSPMIITAHAAESNFGNSINVAASANAAASSNPGGFWSTVSGYADSAWSGAKAVGNGARVCVAGMGQAWGDVSYRASRYALGKYYGNEPLEIAADIDVHARQNLERWKSVDTIGDVEMQQVLDGNKAFQDLVKEGWQNIGSIGDVLIGDLNEKITGVNSNTTIIGDVLGNMADVASGTFVGLSNGVARVANPKSTNGEIAQGLYEIFSSFSAFKAPSPKAVGDAGLGLLDSIGLGDTTEILLNTFAKGYLDNQLQTINKNIIDGKFNDGVKAVLGDSFGLAKPTPKPSAKPTPRPSANNPNVAVGDFNIIASKETAYFGEQIELSTNEVTDAQYTWYTDDADGSVIKSGNSIKLYYLSEGYHFPRVEIFDKEGKSLGSGTTDIYVERSELDLYCNNANPFVGDTITFTLSSNDMNFDDVEVGWDMGGGNLSNGTKSINHRYVQAGVYSVKAVVFKHFEGAGDVVIGMGEMDINVNDYKLVTSRTNVTVGENVSFNVEPNIEGVYYNWQISDGSVKEGANISHSFSSLGTFTVSVSVYNSIDVFFKDSDVVNVEPAPTPSPAPIPEPEQPRPASDQDSDKFVCKNSDSTKSVIEFYSDGTCHAYDVGADGTPNAGKRYDFRIVEKIVEPSDGGDERGTYTDLENLLTSHFIELLNIGSADVIEKYGTIWNETGQLRDIDSFTGVESRKTYDRQ